MREACCGATGAGHFSESGDSLKKMTKKHQETSIYYKHLESTLFILTIPVKKSYKITPKKKNKK